MGRHHLLLVALASVCALITPAVSQEYSRFVGKVFTQRVFYYGSELPYDEQGNLLKPASACSWTICAKIRITNAEVVRGNTLRLRGERLFLVAGKKTDDFKDIFTDSNWHFVSKAAERKLEAARQVEITIQRSTAWDDAAIEAVLSRIFLADNEHLGDHVPIFWKDYFCKNSADKPTNCDEDPIVKSSAKVGGKVKPPRVIKAEDPKYIEIARLAAFQGTTVLWTVVTEQGRASNTRISRAIGLGLDDMAFVTVSQSTFKPATSDGEPVPVQINVEVNYRLY